MNGVNGIKLNNKRVYIHSIRKENRIFDVGIYAIEVIIGAL